VCGPHTMDPKITANGHRLKPLAFEKKLKIANTCFEPKPGVGLCTWCTPGDRGKYKKARVRMRLQDLYSATLDHALIQAKCMDRVVHCGVDEEIDCLNDTDHRLTKLTLRVESGGQARDNRQRAKRPAPGPPGPDLSLMRQVGWRKKVSDVLEAEMLKMRPTYAESLAAAVASGGEALGELHEMLRKMTLKACNDTLPKVLARGRGGENKHWFVKNRACMTELIAIKKAAWKDLMAKPGDPRRQQANEAASRAVRTASRRFQDEHWGG
jgi:hypothetical protein